MRAHTKHGRTGGGLAVRKKDGSLEVNDLRVGEAKNWKNRPKPARRRLDSCESNDGASLFAEWVLVDNSTALSAPLADLPDLQRRRTCRFADVEAEDHRGLIAV